MCTHTSTHTLKGRWLVWYLPPHLYLWSSQKRCAVHKANRLSTNKMFSEVVAPVIKSDVVLSIVLVSIQRIIDKKFTCPCYSSKFYDQFLSCSILIIIFVSVLIQMHNFKEKMKNFRNFFLYHYNTCCHRCCCGCCCDQNRYSQVSNNEDMEGWRNVMLYILDFLGKGCLNYIISF